MSKKTYKKITSCCGKPVSYKRGTKPEVCPFCGDIYWDKPKGERDLFILQDEYFETKDEKCLALMYKHIFNYSENIIKNSISVIYSQEKMEEKAEALAIILLEKYLKDPNFKIEHSFGGLLIRMSKGVLYSKKTKNEDRTHSLDFKVGDDTISLTDNPSYFISDPLFKKDFGEDVFDIIDKKSTIMLIKEIEKIIELIFTRIRDNGNPEQTLLFLIGIRNFFSDSRKDFSDFYTEFGNETRDNIEKTKLVIREYLLKNME
jgi:hypothetical protein